MDNKCNNPTWKKSARHSEPALFTKTEGKYLNVDILSGMYHTNRGSYQALKTLSIHKYKGASKVSKGKFELV